MALEEPSSKSQQTEQSPMATPAPAATATPSNLRSRQTAWWQSSVVRRSSSAVDEAVDELTEKSQFLLRKSPRSSTTTGSNTCSHSTCSSPLHDNTPVSSEQEEEKSVPTIALFDRNEIQVGQLLGEGTFSCVYEVTGFVLKDISNNNNDEDGETDSPSTMAHLRQDVVANGVASLVEGEATTTINNATTRYALKHLKPDLLTSSKDFESAATDIVMEAKYLSALDHPGILKLRGLAFGGTAAFQNSGQHDGYFLLTDRLVGTLAQRIEQWKLQEGKTHYTSTIACKAQYALQIADAVAYLHERRIIFRDLKPSNIGFDNSDKIQLFDFGLCRELPPECRARPYKYYPLMEEAEGEELEEYYASLDESWIDCNNDDSSQGRRQSLSGKDHHQSIEEVYFMSGAGTQIYMAVEILINNRYNLKCDVYSFAMVAYEMLTLQKPFPWYTMEEHIQFVCKEGERPCFEDQEHIPESLQELLEAAWVGDVAERPSMATVCEQLQDIVLAIEAAEEEAESQEEADHLTLPRRFTSHIVETVGQIKQRLLAALDWTFQSILSLFRKSREIESGLPFVQEDSPVEEEGAVAVSEEPSASYTNRTHDNILPNDEGAKHREGGSTSISSPLPQQEVKPLRHNRHALYKRKPSSASTTATTDDEFDEDDVIGGGYGPGMLKSIGSMEVVVERRADSERSAA